MYRNLFILLVVGLIGYHLHAPPAKLVVNIQEIPGFGITYDNKLSIEKPPVQASPDKSIQPFTMGEYTFTLLAEFQVAARVLSTKHYQFDREASLAPVDLALGWGPMAKTEILKDISISQNGRFYHWRTDDFPIPGREIATNSANMHFIPASTEVGEKLRKIRKNDEIKFKGYLVRVEAQDGWRWISSTTRDDTGGGACELVLVEDISPL